MGIALISIIVLHAGPAAIAGQRVSGTNNIQLIEAFYHHGAVLPFWWQGGISLIGIIGFALCFRAYLRTFELGPIASVVLDAATAVMLLETPLLVVDVGLQSALVQLVNSGPAPAGTLALFAAWDWIYNSFTYWFEAAWMSMWAGLTLRTLVLPRWIGVVGAATAVGLIFNSTALMLGLSDNLTLIPTAGLIVWMASTSVYLVRGGRKG